MTIRTSPRKTWKDTAAVVFQAHPDWNAGQIFRELQDKLGKNAPAHVSSVNKVLPAWKKNYQSIKETGIDDEWHLGTLKDYPIPPEAVAKIIEYKVKTSEKGVGIITIRVALWMARLSLLPLSVNVLHSFAFNYASREQLQDILGPELNWNEGIDDLDDYLVKELKERPGLLLKELSLEAEERIADKLKQYKEHRRKVKNERTHSSKVRG